jgi:hypothetical protein
MTAKEKAKELVGKFYGLLPQWVNTNDAKQCALIAVDEIIEILLSFSSINKVDYDYWNDVKKEIEAL